MANKPTLLFAFSHDAQNELPEVRKEWSVVEKHFKNSSRPFKSEVEWCVSQEKIEEIIRSEHNRIQLFHYSGHGNNGKLEANVQDGITKPIHGKGLAQYIGDYCPNIKLVFLNACSTGILAKDFLKSAGAVISTTKPIKDSYAEAFSTKFYKNFISENMSLEEAFNTAKSSFLMSYGPLIDPDTRKIDQKFLDDKIALRGNFELDNDNDDDVITIKFRIPAFKKQTFNDWLATIPEELTVTRVDDMQKLKSVGKDPDGYLLCDRHDQSDRFSQLCADKCAGKMSKPAFVFIHDEEADCPQLLVERLQKFYINKEKQRGVTVFSEELNLPKAIDFDMAGSPDSQDKFKIRLSEIYKEKFGGQDAVQNRLCALTPRPENEQLLVVLHKITPDDWYDVQDNPVKTARLHGHFEALLDFYTNAFAAYLQANFSQRLVVVLYAKYIFPDDFFPTVFSKIETECKTSVIVNFTELPPITAGHIDAWQTDFLGDSAFITVSEFFKPVPEAQPLRSLPLIKAKPKLESEIDRFNQRYVGS